MKLVKKVKHPAIISSLMNPALYDHPVESCKLIETHISWVILTGSFAYKIKKPLNLGFLDFSTLDKRRFYCEEELRLNRRLAPDYYLCVVPVSGQPEAPVWNDSSNPIEFAVKMKQFDQEARLDRILARGKLKAEQLYAISKSIYHFHQKVSIAGQDSIYGDTDHVLKPFEDNFTQIRENIYRKEHSDRISFLERWYSSSYDSLKPLFIKRKRDGFIRECHGDLHLRNLAWIDDSPLVFDCIEFDPNLRWIDVMSEVAFLVMDLQEQNQIMLAQQFLNSYLEYSGDYEGVKALPFYMIYRALVRAKIDIIRARQPGISKAEQNDAEGDFDKYLQLAANYSKPSTGQLLITCGMSGSGKSTITHRLLESINAVRIRSDVERKRLFDIRMDSGSKACYGEGIYSSEATGLTYMKLVDLAGHVLDAGYRVIIDAACLRLEERKLFHELSVQKKAVYTILEFTASPETLRRRITNRKKDVSDADLSILEHQLQGKQTLSISEKPYAITIDTDARIDIPLLAKQIMSRS